MTCNSFCSSRLALSAIAALVAVGTLCAAEPADDGSSKRATARHQEPTEALPEGTVKVECSGTVDRIQEGGVVLETKGGWAQMEIPHTANILIEGKAEPSYLQSKMVVKFTGEVDAKGVLYEPIAALQVGHVKKMRMGIFAEEAGDTDPPVKKFTAGTFQFRGQIRSIKANKIVVVAGGKQITGEIAEDCEIDVESSDMSLVRKGDDIKIDGYRPGGGQGGGRRQRMIRGVAQDVSVTLAETLAGAENQKHAAKATAASRTAPVEKTEKSTDAEGTSDETAAPQTPSS